jgi:GT2 family glycosyltransferase
MLSVDHSGSREPEIVLSFIIPVRNDADGLRRCLASVYRSAQGAAVEVIVADNGSTDPSTQVAREAGAQVLDLPGHRVGELRNRAADRAQGDLLAFVDADHEIADGWVSAALRTMEDVTITATGDLYHAPAGGPWVQQMYDRLRPRVPGSRPVEWLGSGNLVVRRTAFQAVRGFDTTLETCEDVDLCQRLIARGGRIVAVDAMVNVHYGDPRSLSALFRGELWRGRDNLRVSLRAPLTLRSLPSLAIPVLTLLAMAMMGVGVASAPWGGLPAAALGAIAFVALAVPLAVVIVLRTPAGERGVIYSGRALVFSAAYDFARALALVVRAGHRTRRAA